MGQKAEKGMEAVGLGLTLTSGTLLHKALGHSRWLLKETNIWQEGFMRLQQHVVFQGGELVAVVRGANAPLLQKTILDQLEAEKKVLSEGRERKVVRRSLLQAANSQVCSQGKASLSRPCPIHFPRAVSWKLHSMTTQVLTESPGESKCYGHHDVYAF